MSTPDMNVSIWSKATVQAAIFITPAVVLMLATVLAPLLVIIVLSFTNYELGASAFSWIGIDNFVRIAESERARRAIANTFAFTAMVVPVSVGVGLLLALLVSGRGRTRRPYELLLFLPATSTMTVMAIVWSLILNSRIGPVNDVLAALGGQPVDFLQGSATALPTLAMIAIWQHASFCFVIFLAGLTAIPSDLYEAAALDRVPGGWEQFSRITWPLLAPTTLAVVLLTTIKAFQTFDVVAVLTSGGPGGASSVLLYETYLQAFSYFRTGYGSALTMVFIALVSGISVLQMWIGHRRQGSAA